MKIPAIIAPTASGKNNLALQYLAEQPNLAIVNVDSAQIYKQLCIGANLPTKEELKLCPHYLYATHCVTDPQDVSLFLQNLEVVLKDILEQGLQPMLVGGTMMYFHQMIAGLVQVPPINPQKLQEWRASHESTSNEQIFARLHEVDLPMAKKLVLGDTQRIQRALSVFDLTGQTLTYWQSQRPKKFPYSIQVIKLNYQDKDKHRKIIYDRMLKMFEMGFLQEVQDLMKSFPDHKLPFWQYVGYRQIHQGLKDNQSLEEIQQRVYFATCQLAKRQKTWLKKFEGPTLYVDQEKTFEKFKHHLK